MGLFDIFKKGNNPDHFSITGSYKKFYEANQAQPLSFYGLIPFGQKGSSPFHTEPYEKTLAVDFPFASACVWEDLDDEAARMEKMHGAQYGNITIGHEGCGIYWILLTAGKNRGAVWLLTECGVTPVSENLGLEAWREKQLASGNTFWYAAVADWGPVEHAFFYSHAPKKMATAGENVFGVAGSLCKSCIDFISKSAIYKKTEFFVTDNAGTRIFGADGHIETVPR